MNEQYLRLLEVVESLAGSNNIDDIIAAANKIATAIQDDPQIWDQCHTYVTTGYVFGSPMEFLNNCKIPHTRGSVPFILHPFQINILDRLEKTNDRMILINKARQSGISLLLAGYALHQAISSHNQYIALLGHSFQSTCSLINNIEFLYSTSNLRLPKITALNKSNIGFENGSKIFATNFDADRIRGHSLSLAIVDEAAFIPYSKDSSLIASILPMLSNGGKLIMASSPSNPRGVFYDYWVEPIYPVERITVNWSDWPHRDQKWADNLKEIIGPRAWACEYDNKFMNAI